MENELYSWDLDKVIKEIHEKKPKTIVVQVPDGIKRRSNEIVEQLKQHTDAKIFIWAGSCYGSCDIPMELKNLKIDLLLHFGHSAWKN